MKPRHKRLILIALGLGVIAIAITLVLSVFRDNLVFFYSPTQVVNNEIPQQGRSFRIGGLVEKGSVQRQADGVTVSFDVTDTQQTIRVQYRGTLPDLFKECKGVVTQGRMDGATFIATEVLAKHDENYMPKEAAAAVEQAHARADRSKTKCSAADMGQMGRG
jgi:cytochrome c-type biogenesis protein CcmE